jgi:hypothetical protein
VAHPTCDRCQTEVDLGREIHFHITIEIEAGGFVESDSFDRLEETLANADSTCDADFEEAWFQSKQYMLCQPCYQKYVRNPLAKTNS